MLSSFFEERFSLHHSVQSSSYIICKPPGTKGTTGFLVTKLKHKCYLLHLDMDLLSDFNLKWQHVDEFPPIWFLWIQKLAVLCWVTT